MKFAPFVFPFFAWNGKEGGSLEYPTCILCWYIVVNFFDWCPVLRDIRERGRDLEQVLTQYTTLVKPAFEEFCLPVRLEPHIWHLVYLQKNNNNEFLLGVFFQCIPLDEEVCRRYHTSRSGQHRWVFVSTGSRWCTWPVNRRLNRYVSFFSILSVAIDLIVQHIRDIVLCNATLNGRRGSYLQAAAVSAMSS